MKFKYNYRMNETFTAQYPLKINAEEFHWGSWSVDQKRTFDFSVKPRHGEIRLGHIYEHGRMDFEAHGKSWRDIDIAACTWDHFVSFPGREFHYIITYNNMNYFEISLFFKIIINL